VIKTKGLTKQKIYINAQKWQNVAIMIKSDRTRYGGIWYNYNLWKDIMPTYFNIANYNS
jgi:hypothetical protein